MWPKIEQKKKIISTVNIFIKKILKLHLFKKCYTISDLFFSGN